MKKAFLMICISVSLAACDEPRAAAGGKIDVPAAGAKLDPPVEPEQLADGAWFCDMGTVHWAAMEKPADGKCPECGMALKQVAASRPDGEH